MCDCLQRYIESECEAAAGFGHNVWSIYLQQQKIITTHALQAGICITFDANNVFRFSEPQSCITQFLLPYTSQ